MKENWIRSNGRSRLPLAALFAACVGAAVAGSAAPGQDLSALPEYHPDQTVSGVLRSWGSNRMATLMKSWEQGFKRYQPDVYFTDNLKGSQSAQYGLQQMVADMALMGRQIVPYDTYGIWRRSHMAPVEITVATGSYDAPHKTFALAVFVHRDNPLSKLTLRQLDGIFGAQRTGGWSGNGGMEWNPGVARGERENLRTWGQLGLSGEWADKPIHAYGPPGLQPGGMSFFQTRVMGGADTWCEGLREFEDRAQMVAALGRDRYGIAYTGMCYRTSIVKPVALAEKEGAPYIEPTRETVANRTYPLARSIYIYFAPDQQNGDPADPKVDPKMREFLRYILSRQGQEAVVREGSYLPLTQEVVREQLGKL